MKDLAECLNYDPDTGVFTWKATRGCRKAGSIAGSVTPHGYVLIGGKYAHRIAWYKAHGYEPKEIDHINRNRSDNRLSNLREVSRSQNNRNTDHVGASGAKGVWRNGSGWSAVIGSGKLRRYLGTFRTKEEAAAAYRAANARSEHESGTYWLGKPSRRMRPDDRDNY